MSSFAAKKLGFARRGLASWLFQGIGRRSRPISGRLLAIALAMSPLVASCRPSADAHGTAVVLLSKGDAPRAAQLLEQQLAAEPDRDADRRLLIRAYGVTGDLGRAEHHASILSDQLGASSAVPWVELGHAYELCHRFEAALAMYDKAALVAPADPVGPRTGGVRAAHWGELELARPRLEEALRRSPRDAEAWHVLGLVRLHQGDFDGAFTAYQSGLEANPNSLQNRLGLATLALAKGDAAAALREYAIIIAERPRYVDVELGRSLALFQLGRLDEARAALRSAAAHGADAAVVARQQRLFDGPAQASVSRTSR